MTVARFGAAVGQRRKRWNAASGGTVTDVVNYNGTGQTWRVHTFTANGSLVVSQAYQPFRVLVVGGGGGGSGTIYNGTGGSPGNSGTGVESMLAAGAVTPGTYPVLVGAAGIGSSPAHGVSGSAAGASSLFGLSGPGGGGPGGWGSGWNYSSSITGLSAAYGSSPPGYQNPAGTVAGYGAAGGACSVANCGGAPGAQGVVIVAYRIA